MLPNMKLAPLKIEIERNTNLKDNYYHLALVKATKGNIIIKRLGRFIRVFICLML